MNETKEGTWYVYDDEKTARNGKDDADFNFVGKLVEIEYKVWE